MACASQSKHLGLIYSSWNLEEQKSIMLKKQKTTKQKIKQHAAHIAVGKICSSYSSRKIDDSLLRSPVTLTVL